MTTLATRKPKRVTGRASPDPYDLDAQERSERAQSIVEGMWVDTERQRAILNEIRAYMRVCLGRRGRRTPIMGRRLSQFSQAGKSAIAERLIHELEQEALAAGEAPNPYRVIHITIDQRMTLKMLYQEILNRLADDFADEPGNQGIRAASTKASDIRGRSGDNVKILEQRVEEWVEALGVELIVVDEIQRLVTNSDGDARTLRTPRSFLTADALDVTKKLQAFLDRGVVPIVFIGDETSRQFFELNNQFAARLHRPLELRPLDVGKKADRKRFLDFCIEYDRQLVARQVVAIPTCLAQPDILTSLIEASGGHIGRAARIIQVAVPAAVARSAVTLEAYDLSNAVRDFAIGLDWVDHDPFSLVRPTFEPAVEDNAGMPDAA